RWSDEWNPTQDDRVRTIERRSGSSHSQLSKALIRQIICRASRCRAGATRRRNGGSMLESKILPTILIILPSSVFLLLAHPGAGKAAAEKCNTRPSSSAPQGTHWYYRVNRTDNRRCWYLSSSGIKVLSHAR